MNNQYVDRQEWFLQQVGKVIYATKTSCSCDICQLVYSEGIIVIDESHARYIAESEATYQMEGMDVLYFSTKEQRDKYESTIIK